MLVGGHDKLGYDIGTVTSLGLLATTLPRAWATGEPYVSTLATVGGESSAHASDPLLTFACNSRPTPS